jgi:osmotically-inducible protein OsmY
MTSAAVFATAAVCAAVVLCLMAGASFVSADQENDDRIRLRVEVRLSGQVSIDLREFAVRVSDGIATLQGNVGSIGDREKVVRLVSGIVGVDGIVNGITIRNSTRSDASMQEEILTLLERRPRFREDAVDVNVAGGVVSLRGEVERSLDRYDAGEIAASVDGVVEVSNEIVVRTEGLIPLEIVLERVRSVLTNTLTFGVIRDLDVQIDQSGVVLLQGMAPRQSTRETAERLTLGVPGVAGVINRIEVLGS